MENLLIIISSLLVGFTLGGFSFYAYELYLQKKAHRKMVDSLLAFTEKLHERAADIGHQLEEVERDDQWRANLRH